MAVFYRRLGGTGLTLCWRCCGDDADLAGPALFEASPVLESDVCGTSWRPDPDFFAASRVFLRLTDFLLCMIGVVVGSISSDISDISRLFRLRRNGSTSGVASKVYVARDLENKDATTVHRRIVAVAENIQTSLSLMPIGRNLPTREPPVPMTDAWRPSKYWSSVPSPMPTSVNFIHFVDGDTSVIPTSINLVIDVPFARNTHFMLLLLLFFYYYYYRLLLYFRLFLTVFDDWYTVDTVLVDLWRLVHQWFWVFLTIGTVYHLSKTVKRQSNSKKMIIGVQIVTYLHRVQLSLLPSAGREMSSSYGYGVKA